MRKTLIVGNWKMNKTSSEAKQFADELEVLLKDKNIDTDWAIAAPFVSINSLQGTSVPLAAQNVHYENNGAFTGEVSLPMLEDIGIKYVIIGHSERREMFNETDDSVNKKVIATLNTNIVPIVAYGETEEQFEAGATKDVVSKQLKAGLKDIDPAKAEKIVLAYEPIWAIGTGKTATPEQAEEICKLSRDIVEEIFNAEIASKIKILYGGSMNPDNVKELLKQENIDGGLVGGASLEPSSWIKLLTYNE